MIDPAELFIKIKHNQELAWELFIRGRHTEAVVLIKEIENAAKQLTDLILNWKKHA